MAHGPQQLTGPDFNEGVPVGSLAEGIPLLGHAHGEPVILVKSDGVLYATGPTCTHYSAPLAEGLAIDGMLRCAWHHACFDLKTGAAFRPPAFAPIACWRVEERDARAFVRERLPEPAAAPRVEGPESVVLVGGGAAALAAADELRREGYRGPVTVLTAEETGPVDRPNLSKEYLAGTAPAGWIPLTLPEDVTLRTRARVDALDAGARRMTTEAGETFEGGAILLATGAEVVRLDVPGSHLPHVHTLRTFADSKAIVGDALPATQAVVVGAGFVGLEVAASLRARGLSVHVVSPTPPLVRVLGPQTGAWIQRLHEEHGVTFHVGESVVQIEAGSVVLSTGARLPADLVVVGVGVRPVTDLAERAGIAVDRGILVNERLETSVKGVFAAGDAARFLYRRLGQRIRVEHWAVATRMGQAAARAMLGRDVVFDAVPFFWTAHYDVTLNYVGHAEQWDRIDTHGSLTARDATLAYRLGDSTFAVVTVGRDRTSLDAECAFERGDEATLASFGRTR